MTKHGLLEYLDDAEQADAHEVARVFELPYATAAMALLRLTRKRLAQFYIEPESTVYWYAVSERGVERLAYFERALLGGRYAQKAQPSSPGYLTPVSRIQSAIAMTTSFSIPRNP